MDAGSRRELILYATPTGELADQCDRYFERARQLGATAAQAYPPHCTLTGFFRRRSRRADEVADEVRSKLADTVVPADAVEVAALVVVDAWVGLTLRSPWLEATTRQLFEGHALGDGDDPIRYKTDLHLSLAYEVGPDRRDLTPFAAMAREHVDPAAPVAWEVGLWERAGGRWTRLT